jgi:predicted Zn-dependent protease
VAGEPFRGARDRGGHAQPHASPRGGVAEGAARCRGQQRRHRPLLLQGELFLLAGQPKRAVAPLQELVRHEPENFDGWRLLAIAADLSGNRSLQALAQRKALALNPPVPAK